ncbi:hypothetical protein BGZ76_007908 [Entomortierella beljakovae]|nr:hypothetical protein BGZ76_007908 [Entomortierella beljakovae]
MSEKGAYTVLPTTAEKTMEDSPPIYPQQNTQSKSKSFRTGLLKLSAVALGLYFLYCHSKGGRGHHGGCHRNKLSSKYSFESHMQENVDKLVAGSLESSIVWDRLAEMTDTFGNRIAGSEALENSIDWIVENVKNDGLTVTTEDVVVDYWQRNEESLYFLSPTRGPVKLHMLGLGASISTPGVEAEVIVVTSKEELDQLGQEGKVKGRIVLFNRPFVSYDKNVVYRSQGALWAQEHGAVAALVRSVGPLSLQSTHTGQSSTGKIPAASVSIEDSELLARSVKRHLENPEKFPEWPRVKLTMNAKLALGSKVSRNIIVELKGRETPEEVVVIGGHIDSWDVGSGAVDDGAGTFIAWETVRQLSKLDQPPRRTVRAVFWTSEENGSPGGRVYAANHPETNTTRHVFAFESDNGVFDPYGIRFTAGQRVLDDPEKFNSFEFLTAAGEHFIASRKDLSYPGAGSYVLPSGGGADIAPLCKQGVACAHFTPADPFPLPYSTSPYFIKNQADKDAQTLPPHHHHHRHPPHPHPHHHHQHHHHHHHRRHRQHHEDVEHHDPPRRPVDSGYFYYHHTEADSMSAFTPDQVKNSAAVMAVWTYIAAESQVEL